MGPVTIRLALILTLIGLLAGLYLFQASEIAAAGRRIEALRQRRDELRRENAELLDQIARESSFQQLYARALKLGFAPATQVEYLEVPAIPPDTTLALRSQLASDR